MPSIASPTRALWAVGLFLAGTLAAGIADADSSYRLGQGYRLAGLGLTAGGYASIHLSRLDGEPSTLNLKELSLFLHGDVSPAWHFFTELELGDVFKLIKGNAAALEPDFDVERLYLDHELSDRDALRLGKFLSPIGRWNQIHADPLVWSVSRPLTTSAAFARHAAGMELYGSRPWGAAAVDYQLYLDGSAAFDPTEAQEDTFPDVAVRPNPPSSFGHGQGLYLRYRSADDNLQLGLSAARYSLKEQPPSKQLLGLDLFYAKSGWELAGEAIYRRNEDGGGGSDRGGYVQLAAPIGERLHLVLTHERYRAAIMGEAVEWSAIGLTYRPSPPLSLKLEYRDSHGADALMPSGVLCSLSVLL